MPLMIPSTYLSFFIVKCTPGLSHARAHMSTYNGWEAAQLTPRLGNFAAASLNAFRRNFGCNLRTSESHQGSKSQGCPNKPAQLAEACHKRKISTMHVKATGGYLLGLRELDAKNTSKYQVRTRDNVNCANDSPVRKEKTLKPMLTES